MRVGSSFFFWFLFPIVVFFLFREREKDKVYQACIIFFFVLSLFPYFLRVYQERIVVEMSLPCVRSCAPSKKNRLTCTLSSPVSRYLDLSLFFCLALSLSCARCLSGSRSRSLSLSLPFPPLSLVTGIATQLGEWASIKPSL